MNNFLAPPLRQHTLSIDLVLHALGQVAPVPSQFQHDLTKAIRDLSSLLTDERKGLNRSYWSTRRLASAYYHYFLPWNLFRLAWLLPSLDLQLQAGDRILDLGSGPLTLPIALWCARPELRKVPLHFTCVDVATQPMELGKALFQATAGKTCPWTFELMRAPLEAAPAKVKPGLAMIMAGNALNELTAAKGQALPERLNKLIGACTSRVRKDGYLLLIEPGTRLGGKLISLARESALTRDLLILGPCTHTGPCPMLHHRTPSGKFFSSWCHYNCPAQGAPGALAKLTEAAHFTRQSLAISGLFLQKTTDGPVEPTSLYDDLADLEALYEESLLDDFDDASGPSSAVEVWNASVHPTNTRTKMPTELPPPPLDARIVSGPIRLPGQELEARYGCCAAGLVLVKNTGRLPHGAGIRVTWQGKPQRDPKTGALIVEMLLPDGSVATATPQRPKKDSSKADEKGSPHELHTKQYKEKSEKSSGPRRPKERNTEEQSPRVSRKSEASEASKTFPRTSRKPQADKQTRPEKHTPGKKYEPKSDAGKKPRSGPKPGSSKGPKPPHKSSRPAKRPARSQAE